MAAKKKKRRMDDEGEEGDMFADDANDGGGGGPSTRDEGNEDKKKKKGVTFMEASETVQGEVLGSKSGGHVSADFSVPSDNHNGKPRNGISAQKAMNESSRHKQRASPTNNDDEASSSSESSVDDETRADVGDNLDEELGAGSKKHHAPKLDAFNMRAETEEGRFDSSGNYVRKAADPDAVHDIWLEGVSKRDMKRAREAMDLREAENKRRQVEDDKILTKDLLGNLIGRLEVGETVLEALGRLGKGKKKKKGKRDQMDVDAGGEEARELGRREAVEAITGAADMLLSRGQEEIYDTERELLARQYQRETGEAWVDPPKAGVEEGGGNGEEGGGGAGGVWQYRWMDGRDGGKVYGDYDAPTMKAWVDAGFFGDDVEFCRVGEDEWSKDVRFV